MQLVSVDGKLLCVTNLAIAIVLMQTLLRMHATTIEIECTLPRIYLHCPAVNLVLDEHPCFYSVGRWGKAGEPETRDTKLLEFI